MGIGAIVGLSREAYAARAEVDMGKAERYARTAEQLKELFAKVEDPIARMATIAAVLHHKNARAFSWTGFYLLNGESLTVGPYQGLLACMSLKAHTGVCWAACDRGTTVIVDDVHAFPGHIACDSRTMSEACVPVRDRAGKVRAVLDVDSLEKSTFDDEDARGLESIAALVYGTD
jgi:GAF domain-containing protein